MSRYITTKADFTLRRKHKKYSGATIYENDYTTINPMPNALKGEYVIGDSNFVFTSRLGINGQKKHVRGKFVPNPSGSTDENGAWTIDTIIDSGITEETRIRLKPNYTSIRDFACYGSAVKLIQGTINGVITDFPAELWFSDDKVKFYAPDENKAGYSTNDANADYYKLDGNEYVKLETQEEIDEMYNDLSDTAITLETVTKIPETITSDSPKYIKKVTIFGSLLYNEYGIDITTENLQENSVYNPLRYFCLCGSSYNLVVIEDGEEKEYPFTSFDVESTAIGDCYQGKEVEIDQIAIIHFNFSGKKFDVTAFRDNTDEKIYYTYGNESTEEPEPEPIQTDPIPIVITGDLEQLPEEKRYMDDEDELASAVMPVITPKKAKKTKKSKSVLLGAPAETEFLPGAHIRPKKEIVEEYFRTCDDFTYVILDRVSKPIYTAVFETPKETETGYIYDMVSYTWPSLLGGYNPDLSGPYYSYVESLIELSEYYDEFHCDNMWRSLTHEAIKTLDWTYISNSDGDMQDMSTIDTSRIEPITKIYGRQFDDLKLYADNIKSINTITYNQKSNTPDYTLTDALNNSGWETKTLKITSDNKIRTNTLYPGLTSGYTASDANNEFIRRLKLNSQYLFSVKGTRKGLDAMLSMFGFTPDEYKIREYVCVFTGTTDQWPHFCDSTKNKKFAYPLAKDIETINKYKINFNALDPYAEYCGIPVAEVGYWKDGEDYSYIVPWYSHGKTYDDGLYFQMHGGWGKRDKMDIDLEIAPNVKSITGTDTIPLYMETQARLKFAKDFDELLQEAFASSNTHDVFYVTDISTMQDDYKTKPGENITGASHYFILENNELKQFLGYSSGYSGSQKYGWRSIKNSEITQPNSAGTLVLYLESIMDDTTGNNPHIGNGTYDDGMSYISGMSDVFGYSYVNRNFIGIDDDTCDEIKKIKFGVIPFVEDNRKCWFFSDNYNEKYGKNVKYLTPTRKPETDSDCGNPWEEASEKITFREVDVTDRICDIRKCFDRSPFKKMQGDNGNTASDRVACGSDPAPSEGCTGDLGYEITTLLTSSNSTPQVGVNAKDIFQTTKEFEEVLVDGKYVQREITVNYNEKYNRTTILSPFDPENRVGENGEAAANSIVNIKNLDIEFNIPSDFGANDRKGFRQYIENSVIPYLTQMIPSTSILRWKFIGE